MAGTLGLIDKPELIVAIAGPIGIQTTWVVESLGNSLRAVNYRVEYIKVSAEMEAFPVEIPEKPGEDYASTVGYKMTYATALCKQRNDASTLAAVSVRKIRALRLGITQEEEAVPEGVAYIISQLKRPQEVDLLRQVYGRQFILVSAYGSVSSRTEWIIEQIKKHRSSELTRNEIERIAKDLVDRDADEDIEIYGQHLRDTFHKGDLFVDGMDKSECNKMVDRFIQAFFGRTDIAPSKNEYGMYAAKSAALRSSDLSRQVGAAIFSKDGEMITEGCNEVPKAFGGTYWDMETPDFRDVKIGHDPNEQLKNEILRDLFSKLLKAGFLSDEAKAIGSVAEIATFATKPKDPRDPKVGALLGALIMDLTEFGRVVHAEMCAICDAARLGKSVKGATLFCTTFPCHNCAKHILASGISKVIYMEPYPKSRAKELHKNELEIDASAAERVAFLPFIGISPERYREIYQKGRRKNSSGNARMWNFDEPRPMLSVVYPAYPDTEKAVIATLLLDVKPVSRANAQPTMMTSVDPTLPQ